MFVFFWCVSVAIWFVSCNFIRLLAVKYGKKGKAIYKSRNLWKLLAGLLYQLHILVIYKSRNSMRLLALETKASRQLIYKSRNFMRLLAFFRSSQGVNHLQE